MEDIVLVFDCGSTNIRVAAVNAYGRILFWANRRNMPIQQPNGEQGWKIWDLDGIWEKLIDALREVLLRIKTENVKAIIVTTWGADGAPVRRNGALTYPPISWQCRRTVVTMKKVLMRISAWDVYRITGYQVIPFNTLLRLIWLRENCPKALRDAYTWLMMPGLIAYRLTGEFHIDPTSASTMMAMDMGKRKWSPDMLELALLDEGFFPEWREPGEILGYLTGDAAKKSRLPAGIPVIVGGHDTQFAVLGACPEPEDLILSSGTWEILTMRVDRFSPNKKGFVNGMIIEADVQRGLWNPQMLMIGSAVIEWAKKQFYEELREEDYDSMIREAEKVPIGSEGLLFIPSLTGDSGPLRKYGTLGTILGLTLQTTRAHIFRAVLRGCPTS